MENAAEALKMFLGVVIFGTALTVLFRMTSFARDTADQIFEAIDESIYETYSTEGIDKSNRIVAFQDIVPTLYRYAQEGYAVTIIDPENSTMISSENIVARFDLDTESQISSCLWTSNRHNKASIDKRKNSNIIKSEIEKYLNKYLLNQEILKDYTVNQIEVGSATAEGIFESHRQLNSLAKKIYGTGDIEEPVFTYWQSGNKVRDSYITQRVNCDVYGGTTTFNTKYPGVSKDDIATEILGKHKAVNNGNGLFEEYKDNNVKFKEYMTEIDPNEYIKDLEGNTTDLLVFGTLRYAKKREVIYVRIY